MISKFAPFAVICVLQSVSAWTQIANNLPLNTPEKVKVCKSSNLQKISDGIQRKLRTCSGTLQSSLSKPEQTGLIGGNSMDLASFLGLPAPIRAVERSYEVQPQPASRFTPSPAHPRRGPAPTPHRTLSARTSASTSPNARPRRGAGSAASCRCASGSRGTPPGTTPPSTPASSAPEIPRSAPTPSSPSPGAPSGPFPLCAGGRRRVAVPLRARPRREGRQGGG